MHWEADHAGDRREAYPTPPNVTVCATLLRRTRSALDRSWLPRRGPVALALVFAPYLCLLLVALLPFLRWRQARIWCGLLLAGAAASTGRLIQPRRGRPLRTPGAACLSVMSWNILYRNPDVDAMLRFLATAPAGVIALQELTGDHVARITEEPVLAQRFPHAILWPYGHGAGMGLLSTYPVLEHGRLEHPPTLWARIDLGHGHKVVLINAHPTFFPPRMVADDLDTPRLGWMRRVFDPRFLRYNPDYRDDGIARVRRLVEPLLQQGEALLLVGDFNVTEREAAYRELTAGLKDVYRAAGSGMGQSWRPEWLMRLPMPLLRLDYMLSSPSVRPLHAAVDRTPRGSDHCVLHGVFELAGAVHQAASDPEAATRRRC